MSIRSRRFQHLERARGASSPLPAPPPPPPGAAPEPERFPASDTAPAVPAPAEAGTSTRAGRSSDPGAAVDRSRFDALEESQAAPRPPVASGHAARFQPPPAAPLELAEPGGERLPFQRCPRCESDSSAFAAECQQCHAPLDTDEARALNERLAAERRRQAAVERELLARRAAERDRMEQEEREARRQLAEIAAREEGARVRARIDGWSDPGWGGGWGGPGGPSYDPTPLGVRLLRRIRHPLWRLGAVAAAVGIPLLLIVFGAPEPGMPGWGRARLAGLLLISIVISLFSPRWARRRGLWR